MAPIRLITYQDHTDTIAGWARRLGVNRQALRKRLEQGWSVEKTLTTPVYDMRRKGAPRTVSHAIFPPMALYVRQHEALKRQLNRTLRLFIRDAERQAAKLGRELGKRLASEIDVDAFASRGAGVVDNLPKSLPDRSLSVAQETT